jgi:DNA-binding sugar fermentation-stimulating protein
MSPKCKVVPMYGNFGGSPDSPSSRSLSQQLSKTMMLLIVVVGLLFNPGALVMRTRQSAKQPNHLPLAASSELPLEQPNPRKRRKGGATAASTKRSAPCATMPPLLDLGKLVRGTLVKRPSASIRSPYVADVSLQAAKKADGNLVLAHAPALDVGGMCVPGSEVYLSKRDGSGKTSHAIELVRGAPLTNKASDKGVLVGAHPRLGELIAQEVLKRGLLKDELKLKDGWELAAVDNNISMKQQVTLGDSRVDFVLTIKNKDETTHKVVVEVKNVVCADYASGT